jgi:hypothetical protein
LQNPDSVLQALSSSASDHAPLHLYLNASFRPKKRFKFELFWLKLEGFDEAIKAAWVYTTNISALSAGWTLFSETPLCSYSLGAKGGCETSSCS